MPRTSSLTGERRQSPASRALAAIVAAGMLASLFLPWDEQTVIARGVTGLRTLTVGRSGWQAFSAVEIVLLLVAIGVLVLLAARALGPSGPRPGRDGIAICVAAGICCAVILGRMLGGKGTTDHGLYETTAAIRWGMFVALALAVALAYLGVRIARARPASAAARSAAARSAAARSAAAGAPARGAAGRSAATGPPARDATARPAAARPPVMGRTALPAQMAAGSAHATYPSRRRPRSLSADRPALPPDPPAGRPVDRPASRADHGD